MPSIENASQAFEQALLSQDRIAARRVFSEVVAASASVHTAEQLVVPALERIGRGWETGQVALSQVYMSGRICEELMMGLLPTAPFEQPRQRGIAIAVLEDYHLLGKRLVYSALRAGGYTIVDFGQLSAPELVRRTLDADIQLLLISALMLPSALRVREVTAGLRSAGAKTKVVVGGAPFRLDGELWREVGAEAMGRNASDAIGLVARFLGGQL
jgi:methanogenic corrinoid protein MtbC1